MLGDEFVSRRYSYVGTLKIRFKPLYAVLAPLINKFNLATLECCDYYSCDVTEALIRHVFAQKSNIACFWIKIGREVFGKLEVICCILRFSMIYVVVAAHS